MTHRFNIKTIKETSSTNLLMQEWEKIGRLKHGDVLRAVNQSNGIGQIGNFWESEYGKNLTFSLFLETHFLKADKLFQLNKIISLSVYDYLAQKEIEDVKIKWPNDVYIDDKKIAGMLTHNSFLGDKLENSIIGLGLNINQIKFNSDAPNPISLKQITQIDYNLENELNLLLQIIQMRLNQLLKGNSYINQDYLNCLYGFAEKRKFKDSEGLFFGIIKGVDSYGRLIVEKNTGIQSVYDLKMIEFVEEK